MAEMVEFPPSKREFLSSNPSTTAKKKTRFQPFSWLQSATFLCAQAVNLLTPHMSLSTAHQCLRATGCGLPGRPRNLPWAQTSDLPKDELSGDVTL
jgi:hypothetical protein